MFQWRIQSSELLPEEPKLSINSFDSIMWTKQNVSADSILPIGNQYTAFTSELFKQQLLKLQRKSLVSFPLPPAMKFILKLQVESEVVRELHYC